MKHRPDQKKGHQKSTKAAAASPDRNDASVPSRRKWLFRFLAAVVLPLLVLGILEVGLRFAGFGFDPSYFKSEQVGGRNCYVGNEDFGLRFFPRNLVRFPPPIVMPASKAPDVFRIFIFGESAALGDPRPNFGAGVYLEALLAERFPNAKIEVINTSVTAINSHVILPIARECAGHDGDLWIIYMGNNEMVGPFGAATVFAGRSPPLWLVRSQLELRKLRLGQLLLGVGQKLQKADSPGGWRGMEMFVQNQVFPNDPRRERAYESFQKNLDDILEAGLDSGAKMVLSTVAVNLKDCPPFGSVPESAIPSSNRAAFAKLNQDGAAALAKSQFAEARSAFEQASAMCPDSAEARFQLATCLLHLTNSLEALPHFLRAVDDDILPFRADSKINNGIRAAAGRFAGKPLALCDAAEALNAASSNGVAGEELFYEHVHANPNGNYSLALAWAASVEAALSPDQKRAARPTWLSQSECEERLGFTDWNRVSILEDVLQRVQRPPFSGQSGNTQQVVRVRNEIALVRERMTDAAAARAKETYLKALQRAPGDFRLHANFAEFLESRREWKAAIAERKKILELVPNSYFPHYSLGVVLKEAGELDEARDALLKAAALKADETDIRVELGMVFARRGDWEQARQELELARAGGSGNPRIPLYLGEVLWKLNRRDESIQALREAIRLAPGDWQPRYRLASNLAQQGSFSDAAVEYQEALHIEPGNARCRLGLAACLSNLGRSSEALQQLEQVLERDPGNEAAAEMRRKLRGW